ncbi:ParA family protein [Nostoc punctiforme FACHB-252]|uniref:ParA family protein n=1 Tax=Nostoc punctiforme FACHB-252 TaxID=1357509 RepID=A0ABR8HM27_NOSPU|nr:ParA family protein [Nostoc punctiforme]MBD2616120.1 ParA family protein [Nostoc punctiforme FACHB-252]
MLILTCTSLSGGQGKTTTAILLGRRLAQEGQRVLMVDADPQSNLTFYLGHEVEENQPTLLEVLKKQVSTEDGIYEVSENLWLIPADDGLDKAQEFLSSSGMGAIVLSKRLKEVADLFQYCIIDAPPQRSQICLTAAGAADHIIIPAEASSKGVNSLIRTLALIEELREIDAFSGEILGILPFRDKWVGNNQVAQSKTSIETMRTIAETIPVLPSIPESEQFKKAIDKGVTLSSLGFTQLEAPFQQIIEGLQKNV